MVYLGNLQMTYAMHAVISVVYFLHERQYIEKCSYLQ